MTQKDEIPESMEVLRLDKILAFTKKSKHKAADGKEHGQYKFFTSSSTQSKFIDEFDFDGEYLIFGTGGEASLHYCNDKFSTTADCLVAKVKESSISAKYVYYYLHHNIHLLEAGFRGAGLKHISKSYIRRMRISIPRNRKTQDKVVSILDKVEQINQWRRASIGLTDDYLKSIFLEMFGDPIKNDRNWKTKRLENIAMVERGKFSPRPRNDPAYYDGEFPFIQTGDISSSNGILCEWSQTLNEKGKKVSRSFSAGTVVIAIVGATIGETAILGREFYAPDSVVGINVNPKEANNFYIEYLLRFWKPIFRAHAPETARANINLRILKPLEIPVPPLELQNEFGEIMEKYYNAKEKQESSQKQINDLFNALLQKAFRG
jgi:type I restriction enzyme S subunit